MVPDDCRRDDLDHLLTVALVGGPEELSDVLEEDAHGWSPELSFSSRVQAQEALRDCGCTLLMSDFTLSRVISSGALHFAEWQLEARTSTPFFVGEDLLIEPGTRSLHLSGATIAETAHERIANLRSYFDDATLIEQVILHDETRPTGQSCSRSDTAEPPN